MYCSVLGNFTSVSLFTVIVRLYGWKHNGPLAKAALLYRLQSVPTARIHREQVSLHYIYSLAEIKCSVLNSGGFFGERSRPLIPRVLCITFCLYQEINSGRASLCNSKENSKINSGSKVLLSDLLEYALLHAYIFLYGSLFVCLYIHDCPLIFRLIYL